MQKTPLALVTGCNGFVGYWLIDLLLKRNFNVVGIDNVESSNNSEIEYRQIDILNSNSLSELIKNCQPDYIFHLAAISFPPAADKSPKNALMINIVGSINLFEAVKEHCPNAKLLFVGSSKQYGNVCKNKISENDSPMPKDFYAVSKYSGELIGKQYAHDFGLNFYFARSFNHTGPGQSPLFVCSDWASQIANITIEKSSPIIKVGNLNTTLDFLDVRDVVNAYLAIIEKGKAGEVYNVCSGEGIDLRWILSYLIKKSEFEIKIEEDISKIGNHSNDNFLTGDNSKLKIDTGWNKQIGFEKTLDDLYKYLMSKHK